MCILGLADKGGVLACISKVIIKSSVGLGEEAREARIMKLIQSSPRERGSRPNYRTPLLRETLMMAVRRSPFPPSQVSALSPGLGIASVLCHWILLWPQGQTGRGIVYHSRKQRGPICAENGPHVRNIISCRGWRRSFLALGHSCSGASTLRSEFSA